MTYEHAIRVVGRWVVDHIGVSHRTRVRSADLFHNRNVVLLAGSCTARYMQRFLNP